jgi:hypothetical protein
MGQTHLVALQRQQEELHDLKMVMKNMQHQHEQTLTKLPTIMETPRTPRILDLEYQALQDNAKSIHQEQQEQNGKREQQEQREQRERDSIDTRIKGRCLFQTSSFPN